METTSSRFGLYAIADADACESRGLNLERTARALLDAEPPYLQLRAKGRPAEWLCRLCEQLARYKTARTRLIVNDRLDVALAAGADGVHVGQADMAPPDVRRIAPGALVGLSTHEPGQFVEACGSPIDYLALGPIFATTSKQLAEPALGIPQALEIVSRHPRTVPLVLIGGIDERHFSSLAPCCELIAMIGALLEGGSSDQQLTRRCAHLHASIVSQQTQLSRS